MQDRSMPVRRLDRPNAASARDYPHGRRGGTREEGPRPATASGSGIGERRRAGTRRGVYVGLLEAKPAFLSVWRGRRPSSSTHGAFFTSRPCAPLVALPAARWTLPGSRSPPPEQSMTSGRADEPRCRCERVALRWCRHRGWRVYRGRCTFWSLSADAVIDRRRVIGSARRTTWQI